MSGFEAQYSALDRVLHEAAFAAPDLQCAVADIEDIIFAQRFRDTVVNKPVFITSLPRAGTTLLLETLAALPEFASHTYRDMPFVLCPMLWDAITSKFRRKSLLMERAHGDGIAIGFDSPEAFEEILWRAFWPDKYREKAFSPWSASEASDDFDVFFPKHIKKIIALRREHNHSARYVSKNNANIVRIELIAKMFPDGIILMPFRHPLEHADSLRRMHVRFGQMHKEQPFVGRYMEHLGHYEFGKALRPINFNGWLQTHSYNPESGDFWLAYWNATFRYLLELRHKNLVFLSYEKCCSEAETSLRKIADILDIAPSPALLGQASKYHAPRQFELPAYTAALKTEALNLYQDLLAGSKV